MANKKRRDEVSQMYQQKAKVQQYEAATKNLYIFSIIALAAVVLAVVLFSVTFVDVYNPNNPPENRVELKAGGWALIGAAITGDYESVNYDFVDTFYFHIPDVTSSMAVVTLVAFIFVALSVILLLIGAIRKLHFVNLISAALNLVAFVLLIVVMAKASAMEYDIVNGFCGPQLLGICYTRSFAIFPALFALGAAGVSGFATFKYFKARQLLK